MHYRSLFSPEMPVKTCDPKAIKTGKKDVVTPGAILPDGWRAMRADSVGEYNFSATQSPFLT